MTNAILVVETVVLVLLTLLVAGLLRSHAEILRRLHALGSGLDPDAPADVPGPVSHPVDLRSPGPSTFAAAVDLDGAGLRDDAVHVSVTGARHRTLIAFLSSGCLTCRHFWETFANRRELDLSDDIRLVVVTKDGHEESISALRMLAPPDLPVVMSSSAWVDYRVPGSPYFVLVDDARESHDSRDEAREVRIDRELLAQGLAPGDPSLYRTAAQIAEESRS